MCPTVTGNGRTGKVLGPSGSSAFPLGAGFLSVCTGVGGPLVRGH